MDTFIKLVFFAAGGIYTYEKFIKRPQPMPRKTEWVCGGMLPALDVAEEHTRYHSSPFFKLPLIVNTEGSVVKMDRWYSLYGNATMITQSEEKFKQVQGLLMKNRIPFRVAICGIQKYKYKFGGDFLLDVINLPQEKGLISDIDFTNRADIMKMNLDEINTKMSGNYFIKLGYLGSTTFLPNHFAYRFHIWYDECIGAEREKFHKIIEDSQN